MPVRKTGPSTALSLLDTSPIMQKVPLEQAAAEHEELRIALEEWVDPFKGLEM